MSVLATTNLAVSVGVGAGVVVCTASRDDGGSTGLGSINRVDGSIALVVVVGAVVHILRGATTNGHDGRDVTEHIVVAVAVHIVVHHHGVSRN